MTARQGNVEQQYYKLRPKDLKSTMNIFVSLETLFFTLKLSLFFYEHFLFNIGRC